MIQPRPVGWVDLKPTEVFEGGTLKDPEPVKVGNNLYMGTAPNVAPLNIVTIPPDSGFARAWDEALERCVAGVTEGLTEAEIADVRLWLKGHLSEGRAFYDRISRGTHDAIMSLCSMGFG